MPFTSVGSILAIWTHVKRVSQSWVFSGYSGLLPVGFSKCWNDSPNIPQLDLKLMRPAFVIFPGYIPLPCHTPDDVLTKETSLNLIIWVESILNSPFTPRFAFTWSHSSFTWISRGSWCCTIPWACMWSIWSLQEKYSPSYFLCTTVYCYIFSLIINFWIPEQLYKIVREYTQKIYVPGVNFLQHCLSLSFNYNIFLTP